MKAKLSLLIVLLWSIQSMAQTTVYGEVTSDDGEVLPGVTILVKNTAIGTVTDLDGNYSLKAEPTNVLVFSFIGYISQEITVGSVTQLNVALKEDVQALDEVVVVGYGTQKRSDLTGSVSSIRTEDFNPGPVISVSNYLQNTAPGVVLTQTSAQPGGGFDVKVRGTSSLLGNNGPLYVVDGLPLTSDSGEPGSVSRYRSSPPKNPLNGISPDDIISIEVLKDASATAVYGARGANGVILITTKSGTAGKMKIDYRGSYSLQQLANEYDMLNGSEFAQVSNEYFLEQNPTSDPIYSPAQINSFGEGTQWMDEIIRLGAINKQMLSLSGGTKKFKYYFSGNYLNHKGLVESSNMDRVSSRFNGTYTPSTKLKVGINVIGTYIKDQQVPFGATDGGGAEFAGLFDNTRVWSPLVPIYQTDGSYTRHPEVDNIPNPVSLLEIEDEIRTKRILGSTYLEYEVVKGLKAKVNVGYDRSSASRESLVPLSVVRGEQANGEAEIGNTDVQNFLTELTANYQKKIGEGNFSILGGFTYQQFDSEGDNILMTNFADQASAIEDITSADTTSYTEWKERSRLISYLTRINYNIENKYLLTFSFRADGSTKFGPKNKWGYFPSGAIAWKVHNEDFFNSNFIETMKVRASYGQVGNQEIGNKRSKSLYSYSRRSAIGGMPISGLAPLRPQNDDLKWETSTQFNAGVDFSLAAGRIQTSVDVYHKVTSDVLLDFLLPGTSGYETMTSNAGKIENRGIEFSFSTTIIDKAVQWTTSFNFAYNQNTWLDRSGYYPVSEEIEDENAVLNGIYGYQVEGIFQNESEIAASQQPNAQLGMFKFKDANDDGVITPADRVLLGKNDPDFTLGLNNSFVYKNWDFNFFFQGMLGREKHNYTLSGLEDIQSILAANNKVSSIQDRWTVNNVNGSVHSGLAPTDGGDNSLNSLYVEDASFLRLRNVTLGYNFENVKFIDKLRIYADAQNLLTISNYKGLDPETDEFRQYPNAKTYTIGLNVTF
ncbi:MAG: TonB-dependent receptor [Reichenbachiella sp.]